MKNRLVGYVLVVLLAAATACAYYNMLYNARTQFTQAEKMPRERDGTVSRQQKDAYDKVIAKCELMIETYPDSRWVDDAMLLIARSKHAQGNFEGAVAKLDELEEKLPKSELIEKARFLKGQSYAAWGKDDLAIAVLDTFILQFPESDMLDQALYYAGLSAMVLQQEDRAMTYLDRLGREFPKSDFRLNADIEVAEILAGIGQYERSLEIYERLGEERQVVENRYRIWSGNALVYKELGRYKEALDLLARMDELPPDSQDLEDKAESMLLAAESYVGLDSLARAIDTYKNVSASFAKSKYSAESQYRIGIIYQVRMDSLEVAKNYYDQVPRQYAGSEYASDAIKRSSNISTLLKLRESTDEESPEARALRQFSLAEVQLYEFEEPDKAMTEYRRLLNEFPESEFAPRAAYAIGYIYGALMGDSLKAHEAYRFLIYNYPESQQALYASIYLAPSLRDSLVIPVRAVKPDSLTQRTGPARPDSVAKPDSVTTGTGGQKKEGEQAP